MAKKKAAEPPRQFDLPRAEIQAGKADPVVVLTITDEVRMILSKAANHWLKALEGIKNREAGMGLTSDVDRHIQLLQGSDTEAGIIQAVSPQGELDFGDDEDQEDLGV